MWEGVSDDQVQAQGQKGEEVSAGTDASYVRRAGDTIMKWILALVGAGLVASIGLLIDIRVSLATYQADARAMKEQITDLKSWQAQHDRDDRARFQALAKGSQ